MKKQKKQFILLGILLLVCCGLFLGLKFYQKKQQEQQEAREEAEKIKVASLSVDDIQEFSYECQGETLSFVKKDGVWYSQADETIAIAQAGITGMLSHFETVEASRQIAAPEDTAQYGFDAPLNVIKLKFDGQELTFTIGMQNQVTSQYYLMVSGDENVYLTDGGIFVAFQRSLDDLKETESESGEESESEGETGDGEESE